MREHRRLPFAAAVAGVVVAVLAVVPGPAGAQPSAPPAPDPAVTLPIPEPGPAASNEAADEILSGPEYQEPDPSLLDRFVEWLRKLLQRAEPPRPRVDASPPPSGDASVLAWVVLVVLVVLVLFLLRRWRPSRRRRPTEADPLELAEHELRRAPDEWLAEAERLEAAGEWTAALRCRYRSLIGELIERGTVRDLPGRTSGEYRAEVRRRAPEAAGAFAEASYLFDEAWYGHVPTGRAEVEAFRQLAERALQRQPA